MVESSLNLSFLPYSISNSIENLAGHIFNIYIEDLATSQTFAAFSLVETPSSFHRIPVGTSSLVSLLYTLPLQASLNTAIKVIRALKEKLKVFEKRQEDNMARIE